MTNVEATQIKGETYVTLNSLRKIHFDTERERDGFDTELLGNIIEAVDSLIDEGAFERRARNKGRRW
jgi:hypothetical protein